MLAALVVAPAACSLPAKPMTFNNSMARGNQRLADDAKKLNKAVTPLGTNGSADVAAAKSALSSIQSTLKGLKAEFDDVRAPMGSEAAGSLLDRYRDFLQVEQTILDTCLTPIVQALDDPRYPDPASKWQVISPLLNKAAELESPATFALGEAQKAYAAAYNFEAK
jgi:hypothetical protein